ncbi:LicD family-domain-containing protein [Obelidium mucronatum]|nr:LicD family-domain-containing protein [Obelidium mucronatum]
MKADILWVIKLDELRDQIHHQLRFLRTRRGRTLVIIVILLTLLWSFVATRASAFNHSIAAKSMNEVIEAADRSLSAPLSLAHADRENLFSAVVPNESPTAPQNPKQPSSSQIHFLTRANTTNWEKQKTFTKATKSQLLELQEPHPSYLPQNSIYSSRFLSYDTGNLLTIPLSHFSLSQPPPAIYKFNEQNALTIAKRDRKYFYECGPDAKQDYRFISRESCAIDNFATKPADYKPPKVDHDMTNLRETLLATLQAWSHFAHTHAITWWISHGELLGWYWNGKLIPWDPDLDIQMSTYELVKLVRFNQTVLEGRFLVDVNPGLFVRSPQERNTIDARVVDMRTGFMMDITGLSLLNKEKEKEDGGGVRKKESKTVYCKSPHEYEYDELMPLHETVLDGITVWRPRAVINVLKSEFSEDTLRVTKYWVAARKDTFVFEGGEWILASNQGEHDDQ